MTDTWRSNKLKNTSMAEIKTDDNRVETMTGVLNTDGATPTAVKINPTTHILDVDTNAGGSDFGKDLAARDNSGRTTMIATDASGNIIPLYVDSSGKLLISV